MTEPLSCNIYIDLLPLSLDEKICPETQVLLSEHLQSCENCRHIMEEMSMDFEPLLPKAKPKKHHFKRKSLLKIIIWSYVLLLTLIMAFCIFAILVLP